jgi:transcription elongation factor Elf1
MKHQKNKKNAKEDRTSFTEMHFQKMDQLEHYRNTKLPIKRKQLKKLLAQKTKNHEEIAKLERDIELLESQNDMTEYLLDIHEVIKMKSEPDSHDVYQEIDLDSEKDFGSIDSFCIRKSTNHKSKILDEYLQRTTGNVANAFPQNCEYTKDDFLCLGCSSTNLVVEARNSSIICSDCGMSRDWQDPNLPQWSNEVDLTKQYRYKRQTYFIDHLNRMQAKENVTFPVDLMQDIMKELHKMRITDVNHINEKLIKKILRSLRRSEYYDNVHTIILKLSGRTPPRLTPELEATLINMFQATLEPFETHKHLIKGRSNYLSYPYVIRKLLNIIAERDNHIELKMFGSSCSLLKSHEKLRDQEKVWEKICKDLNWPFHKSI